MNYSSRYRKVFGEGKLNDLRNLIDSQLIINLVKIMFYLTSFFDYLQLGKKLTYNLYDIFQYSLKTLHNNYGS